MIYDGCIGYNLIMTVEHLSLEMQARHPSSQKAEAMQERGPCEAVWALEQVADQLGYSASPFSNSLSP